MAGNSKSCGSSGRNFFRRLRWKTWDAYSRVFSWVPAGCLRPGLQPSLTDGMNSPPTAESAIEPHEPHWLTRGAFQILVILLAVSQVSLGFAVYRGNYWLAVPLVLVS